MLTEREILQINLESHFLQLFVKLVDCPITNKKQGALEVKSDRFYVGEIIFFISMDWESWIPQSILDI